jgi:hypothetical protein
LVWVVLIASWLITAAALAHHGWSQYDANKTLNLRIWEPR